MGDASSGQAKTLWHGRFASGPSDIMFDYTASLSYDSRLFTEDITGSRAHVRGLQRSGLISSEEATAIDSALVQVESELLSGAFVFVESDEDIHTAVERRVTELAGPAGAKLHTGRSRNDQTVTNTRLYCKKAIVGVTTLVLQLQETLLRCAHEAGDTYLPGYTHLQRAQPVLLSHHFAAHAWALARDIDRLLATRARLDVSPLGAGALAGSSLPLDPDGNANDLGFASRFDNSLDAVSDRDFVADVLYDLSLIAIHLSRIGEEFVLWSSEEFGFVRLDDAFSTGSSMLPQKKNADIAELARGKAGRAIGNLTGLLVTLKGLPLAYNRDLGEDKEFLFDSVDQTLLGLRAVNGMIDTATYVVERMQEAADSPASAATDLAEWLVQRGTPFRQAHAIVGALVRQSLDDNKPLVDLVAASPDLGGDAVSLLDKGASVRRRTSPGAAGPAAVAVQLQGLRERVDADKARLAAL